MTLPLLEAGRYLVEIDCVAQRVGWFAQFGSKSARIAIDVIPGVSEGPAGEGGAPPAHPGPSLRSG